MNRRDCPGPTSPLYKYRIDINHEQFATNLEWEHMVKLIGYLGKNDKPYTVVAYPRVSVSSPKIEKRYDLTDDGKGKKYDNGKSMAGTLCRVFPRALLAVGQCIEFGTRKYPKPDNWKLVDGAFTRYQDSLIRHYLKFQAGQEKDSETDLLHLSHMVWNALAILELYLMEHKDEYDNQLFK